MGKVEKLNRVWLFYDATTSCVQLCVHLVTLVVHVEDGRKHSDVCWRFLICKKQAVKGNIHDQKASLGLYKDLNGLIRPLRGL